MGDALTQRIIGAAIEVHRILGPGLLESIYEEALCRELSLCKIEHKRQVSVDVKYKGSVIKGQRLAVEFGLPLYHGLDGPQLETDWILWLGWQYVWSI